MAKKRYSIRLAHAPGSLLELERFSDECVALNPVQRMRIRIVLTEVFENILMHTRPLLGLPVRITCCSGKSVRVSVRFFCRACFICHSPKPVYKPYYDAASQRYRGLGLTMCKNLSRSISYRRGLFRRSIIIIL